MGHDVVTVDVETGELIERGQRSDEEWESYIRDASPESAIIQRGVRWLEFSDDCRRNHGKQGGSRLSEFALQRFGMSPSTVSMWVRIGKAAPELFNIVEKFACDWLAIYEFTGLSEAAKKTLIESGETITRKQIRNTRTVLRQNRQHRTKRHRQLSWRKLSRIVLG